MKNRTAWHLLVLTSLCLASLSTGCKKQDASAQASALTYQHLPDATNVTAALDQKDYEAAIAALSKVKESVSTEEQQNEFRALMGQVQLKIGEAAASDPKAAEAMQALRVMISGR